MTIVVVVALATDVLHYLRHIINKRTCESIREAMHRNLLPLVASKSPSFGALCISLVRTRKIGCDAAQNYFKICINTHRPRIFTLYLSSNDKWNVINFLVLYDITVIHANVFEHLRVASSLCDHYKISVYRHASVCIYENRQKPITAAK